MTTTKKIEDNVQRCIAAISISAHYFSNFGDNTDQASTYSDHAAALARGAAYIAFALYPELRVYECTHTSGWYKEDAACMLCGDVAA